MQDRWHKRNPRLLLVTRAMEVGGTERHLTMLAPALVARGFDVTVYCIARDGAQLGELSDGGLRLAGAKPLFRSPKKFGSAMTLATGAIGLLPEMLFTRPDIAHFFLPHAYLAGSVAAALTQVPVRIMSRRCQNVYQRKRPLLARLEHALHRGMTAVLGNSQRVVDELIVDEGLDQDRAGLIYNGVDLAKFATPLDRTGIRQQLGIAPGATVIACLANLNSYKGHADLLRALARAKGQLPQDWHLVAIGRDDGALPALKAQSAALGLEANVHWLGSSRDTADLLRASDIGVLASHQEGFSNAIIESMAAGLPMVVTDVGGNVEAVRHGTTGLVVPAHDPAALSSAIVRIAANPELAETMGRQGRERAVRDFSLGTCLDRYESLYRSLLQGTGIPAQIRAHRSTGILAHQQAFAGEFLGTSALSHTH